jgi:hypothetical protein
MSEENIEQELEKELESVGVENPNNEKEPESMVASGPKGEEYNWNEAPDGIKAPDRVAMNGMEVVIKEAKIILPPKEYDWELTKTSKKEFKACKFTLYYDYEGQQENYSGVRVFAREKDGEKYYSHPTIYKEGTSQAAVLLKNYAKYKEKSVDEISLKEFLSFLNSKPKVLIKTEKVKNPETGEEVPKNFVEKFI